MQRARDGDKADVKLLQPLKLVADLALPPRCPGCGAVTGADHRFCARCWDSLTFLGPPWCASCQFPFDFDRGEGAQCGACLSELPPHDGVRAAVAYGSVARGVALKLKYGGRLSAAETMARAMVRLVPDDTALFVPVPLHRWRIWSRGFNQAALIADAMGKMRGVPVARDLLRRTRATPVLRGLGHKGRERAVWGAFALAPGAKDCLAGKTIVLVDDVHTSGATAGACARVLKRSGAAKVILLCWARVLNSEAALD